MRRTRVALAVAGIVFLVVAPSGAAAGERFGASISPAPLIVEHWDAPAVNVRNRGDVPIAVVLTIDGDGWAPARTEASVPAGGVASVPIARIGEGEAKVRARVRDATLPAGTDAAVIELVTVARHETPLERYGSLILGIVTAALVAFLAAVAVGVMLRRRKLT